MNEIGTAFEAETTLYRQTMEMCKESGMTAAEAKAFSKDMVYANFPELKGGHLDHAPRFWALVSTIVTEYYPEVRQSYRQSPQPPLITTAPEKKENFMQIVRDLASGGFVPFGAYLIPLIGHKKAQQMSSYVTQVAAEGKYSFSKNGHGWVATPIAPPRTKEMIAGEITAAIMAGDWQKFGELAIELQQKAQ